MRDVDALEPLAENVGVQALIVGSRPPSVITIGIDPTFGLLAVARFLEFFLRSDSADLALGLEVAQWTSLALLAAAAAGAWFTLRGRAPEQPRRHAGVGRTRR